MRQDDPVLRRRVSKHGFVACTGETDCLHAQRIEVGHTPAERWPSAAASLATVARVGFEPDLVKVYAF